MRQAAAGEHKAPAAGAAAAGVSRVSCCLWMYAGTLLDVVASLG